MSLGRPHVALTAVPQSRVSERRLVHGCAKAGCGLEDLVRYRHSKHCKVSEMSGVHFLRDAQALPGSCTAAEVIQLQLHEKSRECTGNVQTILCVIPCHVTMKMGFLFFQLCEELLVHLQRVICSTLERCALI